MAGSSSSIEAVVLALAANTFVAAIKLVAFLLSGSGAMLSEAIHSFADTGNQVLLFLGLRRGAREADDRFHYGYSGERFVFGMLSAAGIFFVGCGVTVYHGVTALLHPHMPELSVTTFAVLATAFVIEGGVLLYAIRALLAERRGQPFLRYLRERADPATVAILLEDGAALLGLVLAGGGIILASATGDARWDAAGSILVGVILGGVAVHLVFANRELLLGRAVPEGIEDRFTEILVQRPAIRAVRDVKTRQLAPDRFTFKAEVVLEEDHLAESLRAATAAGSPRRAATVAIHAIAAEIQACERAVRAEIPQAQHIDLEIADPTPEPDDVDKEDLAAEAAAEAAEAAEAAAAAERTRG